MNERVDKALVLRVIPLRESDVLVHLLGASIGRRSAVAKGARKSRKRFGGALQPFTLVEVERRKNAHGGLDALTSATVEEGFPGIRQRLEAIALASHFCELCDLFLPEGDPAPEVYELLLLLLHRLDQTEPTLKHWLIFLARLLDLTGLRPRFDTCEETGQGLDDAVYLDGYRATVLCAEAAQGRRSVLRLEPSALRTLEALLDASLESVGQVRLLAHQAKPLIKACLIFLRQHHEYPLKTLPMVEASLVPEGL